MTIPIATKITLLKTFHTCLDKSDWSFQDNGPNEKDAPLLKEFGCVIEEFQKLNPEYKIIIKDITKRMGYGMILFLDPSKRLQNMKEFQQLL